MSNTKTYAIINDFKTLLNEIGYSWEYPNYDIIDHGDGTYSINKLYIYPAGMDYKTSSYVFGNTKVYYDFKRFVHFLNTLDDGIEMAKYQADEKTRLDNER